MPTSAHLILYVRDQAKSTSFYSAALGLRPTLDTPGMTEFTLGSGVVLGLMPEDGIKRLLGDAIEDPAQAAGVPRAELYLVVDDPMIHHGRALAAGARELSPFLMRSWGHRATYLADLDGHVLVFAAVVH